MKDIKYSITSNRIKLFKHLENLRSLQLGTPKPILLHFMPTTNCNLSRFGFCENCCFKDANKSNALDLDLEYAKKTIEQFRMIGTKAIEMTGFGDITVYKHINELIDYCHKLGFSIGANTNGNLIRNIKNLNKLKWLRLSMNTLDFFEIDKAYDMDYIRTTAPNLEISGCYVNTSKIKETLPKLIKFVNKENIFVRIVPNCIDTKDGIDKQISYLKKLVPKHNPYLFVSDFNVNTEKRRNNNCYMHLIKPALAPDGWVYSCPSSELALENGTILNKKFRICKGEEVFKFYTSKKSLKIKKHDCSYCKYNNFNEIIEDLLIDVKHKEFT